MTGANGADRAGTALRGVGDLDGDSTPDLAIGAPYEDTAGDKAGSVFVVYGGVF